MKKCRGCGEEKNLSDFYKHPATKDGFASKCKQCARAIVKQAREKRPEYYREFDRARANRPDRVAAREAYQKTKEGKEAIKRARLKYAKTHPERRSAQVALNNAVRDGRVVPWPVCSVSTCNHKPEAHHPDYSQPLSVVWLCRTHHDEVHSMTTED